MHVIFVAPEFPSNQRRFVRGLKEVGAVVTGIGEVPLHAMDDELRGWLDFYEYVPSVTHVGHLDKAVARIQQRGPWVDRLEAVIEAHMLPVAQVREKRGIPGLTAEQVLVCRDKALMKDVLRKAGIPCAASARVHTAAEALAFVEQIGWPVVVKPIAGAGASGTYRCASPEELAAACAELALGRGGEAVIEEFIEGHEGFFDTITVDGEVLFEGIAHYFPNVLHAMRTRDVAPRIVATNQVESNTPYAEVRKLGRDVIKALGLGTTPTHMEWFFGPKGLKFSEIGARPPGVGFWDVYSAANDMDLYRAWAHALVHGTLGQQPSRRYAAALVALRPNRDGRIAGYGGVEAVHARYGNLIFRSHLPHPGTPTQPVEAGYMANAWMMVRHPDFDHLNRICDDIGRTLKVWAE